MIAIVKISYVFKKTIEKCMNSLISLIFIPRGKRKAQLLKTKGSLKKKPRLGYILEENQAF